MTWVQNYDPLGSVFWSTVLAGLPVAVLLGLLASGVSAVRASAAGLLTALLSAILGFGMPVQAAFAAAAFGGAYGLLPIGWIVFSAVFLYHLTVRSGQFEVVKRTVAAVSPDRRMQALLIAFSFGAFLEGAAGFGTPVAISAGLLIGLGFTPLYAAGLALIANTSPVAFGALGTPILALSKVSGIDEFSLSQMAGRQLPLFSMIVPAWLVWTMSGWRGVLGAWPAIVVCGGSFAVIQFTTSNFHGPALVDVAGGLGSLVATAVFLRFWKPSAVWRFPSEPFDSDESSVTTPTLGEAAYAWMPWVILSMTIFAWGWPEVKTALSQTTPTIRVVGLDGVVYRTGEVAPADEGSRIAREPESAKFDFQWLSATGTGIFVASILSAFWLRIGLFGFLEQLISTLYQVRWALLTIMCMLALAFVTRYGGSDATLGLAFTNTGWLYPFFAPLLGWLGVALTGSDTSSNVLFGSLQRITAEQLELNPTLIVASNSTGGVMGKMIDAQSIVVAAVATGQHGSEGRILRFVLPHSIALAAMVGLLTLLQAYVLPWMVP